MTVRYFEKWHQLASLFDVRVGEVREREAGDACWWDGEPGVSGGAAPAGLQHSPDCRGRRGNHLRDGLFIRLGQEGWSGGGEVIVPLKTTTCKSFMNTSKSERLNEEQY